MFTRRVTLSLMRGNEPYLEWDELKKELDLLIGEGNDKVDAKTFRTLCENHRKKAEIQKETWLIKDLTQVKRKIKPDGNYLHPEIDDEDYPKKPKIYPKQPYIDEEESENNDSYPYPKNSKDKPVMPPIENGKISIESLISYLEQLSRFKKIRFNETVIRKKLLSNQYRALRYDEDSFNPIVITRASEILM